jgi:hypothetical protein
VRVISESTGRVAIPCRGHFREEGILPEPKSERPGSAPESVVGRNGPRELLVLAQPHEPPQGSGDRMIELRRAQGVGTYAAARAGDEDRVVVFQQLQVLVEPKSPARSFVPTRTPMPVMRWLRPNENASRLMRSVPAQRLSPFGMRPTAFGSSN